VYTDDLAVRVQLGRGGTSAPAQGDHSPGKPGKVGIPKWSGKMEKVRGSEIRCVFPSCRYSKTRFSAGAPPRTPLGELTTLHQAP